MFWDTVAPLYTLFENLYNGKVNRQVRIKVANLIAPSDRVLECACLDNSFDKVVAGNVIHLLDNPSEALNELLRVCKPGGKLIIPTYINIERNKNPDIPG